jgi:DNA-binding CsgD family transcriptional regulator
MAQSDQENTSPHAAGPGPRRAPLTKREREILGLLSEGMSGSQIAAQLVLSPETVRTHVRNAMAKLGASTRSQAVALALRNQELAGAIQATPQVRRTVTAESHAQPATDPAGALGGMLAKLVSLYDVDGGAIYLTGDDGLSLRRVASVNSAGAAGEMPATVALGDGALGRAGL